MKENKLDKRIFSIKGKYKMDMTYRKFCAKNTVLVKTVWSLAG